MSDSPKTYPDDLRTQAHCEFGCTGDDVAVHYGWFRCTPETRIMLAKERRELDRRHS